MQALCLRSHKGDKTEEWESFGPFVTLSAHQILCIRLLDAAFKRALAVCSWVGPQNFEKRNLTLLVSLS